MITMYKLQVKIDDVWEYVFCRNELKSVPIITKDKSNAIKGNSDSLNYFQNIFGTHEFRIAK